MNNTQCPHCFTDYVISDEQLRLSQGKVRCGNCLEYFDAYSDLNAEKALFDPRNAFVEPLSEDKEESLDVGVDDIFPDTRIVDFQDHSMSSVEVGKTSQDTQKETPVEEASNSENSTRFLDPSTVLDNNAKNFEHITEDSIQFDNQYIEEPSVQTFELELETKDNHSVNNQRIEPVLTQTEMELTTDQNSETSQAVNEFTESETRLEVSTPDIKVNDEPLATEELVIDANTEATDVDDFFITDNSKRNTKKTSIWVWLISPFLLIIIAALSIAFTFQLWQKQMISWPDRKDVRSTLEPITTPILKKLNEFDIIIPDRRSLGSLQLQSATTEVHPTRSSTLLLKVSLINKAKIEQSLPWLELSLTNREGKIISRRSLSPKDYIHNNRISGIIKPNELKKVTIELLSFPKHAAGYELRLLNK